MIGDSRHLPLKDKSVNAIITSPPYWSLRKYDIPDLIWDEKEELSNGNISSNGTGRVNRNNIVSHHNQGKVKCGHEWGNEQIKKFNPQRDASGGLASERTRIYGTRGEQSWNAGTSGQASQGQFCLHCSAWRGQLGLEPTIDLYLKHLMQIMDECWRVLREDGTMWVNLGDSYGGNNSRASFGGRAGFGNPREGVFARGLEKSLCLIPECFAIEMVNRGWILRNKIIWHKPNCMPASVKDRFTVDFEPVFFFVKSRKYWFEQQYDNGNPYKVKVPDGWDTELGAHGTIHRRGRSRGEIKDEIRQGRNRRCVWTIPTQPYPESHFATFPEALIEPMIKAGCPKEICIKCGKAREKIYNVDYETTGNNRGIKNKQRAKGDLSVGHPSYDERKLKHVSEIGLTDCGCHAGFRPGVCLDPFCGSGTTMRVAEKLNRIGVGFDLGYSELQQKRISGIQKELLI